MHLQHSSDLALSVYYLFRSLQSSLNGVHLGMQKSFVTAFRSDVVEVLQ